MIEEIQTEVWKDVEGYSSYSVSNLGKVLQKDNQRAMPLTVNGGFWCTNLITDTGIKVLCKIHRLVAIAFVENPTDGYFVGQYGDKLDASAINLYWKSKPIKPEKIKREQVKVLYQDIEYALADFANLCKCDRSTLTTRLKNGWTTLECKLGYAFYKGQGYQDSQYWYPTKSEYEQAAVKNRADRYLQRKTELESERQEGIDKRKQDRLNYKKWGIGNFVNYPIPGIVGRKQLKVYRVWSGMISRCYSVKNQNYSRYGGRGVYVCNQWHEFQNFAAWYYSQYKEDDWHLDKDILSEDNLVYSPSTCTFVPPVINTFFATLPKNEGYVPTLKFSKGGWKVSMSDGYYKYNKTFKTEYEGFLFYKKIKETKATELAKEYSQTLNNGIVRALLSFKVTLPNL